MMSKVCVDVERLPPFLSPLSHHTSRRCGVVGETPVMHLIWHALSVSGCPSVSVSGYAVKSHFHYGCVLRCVCVATDTETRTVFLIYITTQRHATQCTAAVMEISL